MLSATVYDEPFPRALADAATGAAVGLRTAVSRSRNQALHSPLSSSDDVTSSASPSKPATPIVRRPPLPPGSCSASPLTTPPASRPSTAGRLSPGTPQLDACFGSIGPELEIALGPHLAGLEQSVNAMLSMRQPPKDKDTFKEAGSAGKDKDKDKDKDKGNEKGSSAPAAKPAAAPAAAPAPPPDSTVYAGGSSAYTAATEPMQRALARYLARHPQAAKDEKAAVEKAAAEKAAADKAAAEKAAADKAAAEKAAADKAAAQKAAADKAAAAAADKAAAEKAAADKAAAEKAAADNAAAEKAAADKAEAPPTGRGTDTGRGGGLPRQIGKPSAAA